MTVTLPETLAFAITLPVLGIPTRFETDDSEVYAAILESFGSWSRFAAEPGAASVRVGIRVEQGTSAALTELRSNRASHGTSRIRHVFPDAESMLVQASDGEAVVDFAAGEAVGWVSRTLIADSTSFRAEFLEAMTLALLTHFDRHPIHAAAIRASKNAGPTLLLAGASGAGKSTLAYLAHSNGLHVVAEDIVWVQLDPALQLWGRPKSVRLLPDAVARLSSMTAVVAEEGGLASGERDDKARIQLAGADGAARVEARKSRARLCLLERGAQAGLTALSADCAQRALLDQVAPGFDRYPRRFERCVQELTRGGAWRLTLSGDPRDALPLLHEMLR